MSQASYLFPCPGYIVEALATRGGKPPQHNAHVGEYKALMWDVMEFETELRIGRAIAERHARGDYL